MFILIRGRIVANYVVAEVTCWIVIWIRVVEVYTVIGLIITLIAIRL